MDQFRQVGEVLGSLKALMVLKDDIPINRRQCCLLLNIFILAFETIAEEIRGNLRLEERSTKWKALENPMKELYRIMKEGEGYIRQCLDIRDWWGKAISLHQNKDCVEFHIHNLFCCFPIVIEAIEAAGEISGLDQEDMQKKRLMLTRKYDGEWNDPKLFQWKYGKQYLVPREICSQLDSAWREDRWLLLETVRENRSLGPDARSKHEQRLGDLLTKKLNGLEPSSTEKLLPSWILLGAKDYNVKRRLGSGASYIKEILWFGESFALKHFFGEIEPLNHEISLVQSLSHPNIMQYLCGFYDEEKKEGFLVMELLNKSLSTYIKENSGQRKRVPFSIPVVVDILLQIARGMEYLHSQKIYHGSLNPSNVLLKARSSSTEGYFYAKIMGFGLVSIKNYTNRTSSNQNGINPLVWYAPEVLAEQEQPGSIGDSKCTEKADVYSFGMLCFHLLTGKVPFEDHLQEDKVSRNIRAGERPLFPYTTPKYLANLTKKCWQADPNLRPSFPAICRILRYIKKCLVINPYLGQPESPPPLVDFCDIEAAFSKNFPTEGNAEFSPVSQIPFQMFAYRLIEKDKTSGSFRSRGWDLANDATFCEPASICGDENDGTAEDMFSAAVDQRSVCSDFHEMKAFSRLRADQRSVCSETPLRRVLSTNAADRRFGSETPWKKFDQGSVGSETPWGKFDQKSVVSDTPRRKFDQKSVGSETPRGKLDQKSVGFENPWRKFDRKSVASASLDSKLLLTAAADQSAPALETPNNEALPTTAVEQDQNSVASEIPEEKRLPTAAPDQRSVSSEIADREISSIAAADHKPTCPGIREKRNLSRTRSNRKSIFSEIPEEKTSASAAADKKSVCSLIPETKALPLVATDKKIVTKKASNQRSIRSELPEKKVLLRKKLRDAKSGKDEVAPKGHSPRSPVWIFGGYSPKSSPRSSPRSPYIRGSRMGRDSPLPSYMSPIRHIRGNVSD